jgi:hypothetical protein
LSLLVNPTVDKHVTTMKKWSTVRICCL